MCLRAGLHRLRRIPRRGFRREDRQDHGSCDEDRVSGHRSERLRRRPDSRGSRFAGFVRRDFPSQCPGVRRDPPGVRDHGTVRGRGCVLAGDHRLHGDDRSDITHVHHRPRRHQDRDRRGCFVRGSRRSPHPQQHIGCRPLHGLRRERRPGLRALPVVLPSQQQPVRSPGLPNTGAHGIHRRRSRPGFDHPRLTEPAVRHASDPRNGAGRR